MKADKEFIEAMRELLNKCEEEKNWLYSVPEKHRKFAAYWDEIGRPELQANCKNMTGWVNIIPDWTARYYRIKDDPHWELRLKWVNSDKTLPIETKIGNGWFKCDAPEFYNLHEYREAKPWYEQEISEEKPILLWGKDKHNIMWYADHKPKDHENWTPLTDQEIDKLKRGF